MTTDTTNDLATAALGDTPLGLDQAPDMDTAVIDASVLTEPLAFLAPGSDFAPTDGSIRFPWGGPNGGRTVRVNTSSTGGQSNGNSYDPAVSANGRFVAFESFASNLAPNDTNGTGDVFVKDLRTGQLTLASTNADGTGANNISVDPSLSADGRFVAFASFATNLLPGGTEGEQIFVKDLHTGRVTLASADAGGEASDGRSLNPAISPNGRYVSFSSEASNLVPGDTNNTEDVFLKDLWTGGIDRLTNNAPADNPYGPGSERSSVANTGAVAFNSAASNLVPNDTNGAYDIFLST